MSISPTTIRRAGVALGVLGLLLMLLDMSGVIGGPNRLAGLRVVGVVVSGLLVLTGVIAPRVMRQPLSLKRLADNLSLLFLSTILTFGLIEAGARVCLWHFASEDQFKLYASIDQLRKRYGEDFLESEVSRYALHRYLQYYPTPDFRSETDRHNVLGFRGDEILLPKPDGVYRIVCLGGSTIYGVTANDYTEAYPYLLQQYLHEQGYTNVEVVNAGANAYSSWESLINLEFRVLDLDPDLIIVYHGTNDINSRFVWPPSAYHGDNTGTRKAFASSGVQMPPLWEYSTALRVLMIKLGLTEPHSALGRTLDPHANTYYAELFVQQWEAGTYPHGFFRRVSAAEMLEANPPLYFERNLRSMVTIAEANGIETVLVTFAYSPLFEDLARVGSPEYQAAYAEGNEVVRHVAATTGAFLYDFAQEMPPDKQYYVDGRHFTLEGNALWSALSSDFLIESGLLPPPIGE